MYILVLVTAGNTKEAHRIAHALIHKKLAACVNIVDPVASIFWWQGKIDRASEALLMIKSKKRLLPKIIKVVKAHHSYVVPEIIALTIVGGEKQYLKWIDDSTR